MPLPALVVIADDLTGALDTAGPFAACGLRTRVVPWTDRETPVRALAASQRCDVLVIDTASRHLAAASAAARVRAAARAARQQSVPRLYKKIDSTLRGAVLAELQAFRQAASVPLLPVIPAYPAQGRSVRGGQVYVDGLPVRHSGVARDPRGGPDETTLAMLRQPSAGFELIDAETDADLRRVARTLHREDRLGATAGSGGFARALAALMTATGKRTAGSPAVARSTRRTATRGDASRRVMPVAFDRHRPMLVIAGSPHAVTRGQLRRAVSAGMRGLVLTAPGAVPAGAWTRDRDATVAVAGTWMAQGDDVFLALPAVEGLLTAASASRAARALAGAALRVMQRTHPPIVVAIGGDTVAALVRAAGITHLDVAGEVTPGVAIAAWPRASRRGTASWLVTKSGAFGHDDLLIALRDRLGRR